MKHFTFLNRFFHSLWRKLLNKILKMESVFILFFLVCTAELFLFQTANSFQKKNRFSFQKNKKYALKKAEKYCIYVFLSPECPMCVYYLPILNEIHQKSLPVIGLLPNYYANDSIRKAFVAENNIHFEVRLDSNQKYVQLWKASLTPEVILTNASKKILYRGQIDNTYLRAGKKRAKTTEFYLKDALIALQNHKRIPIPETKAIGCFIISN